MLPERSMSPRPDRILMQTPDDTPLDITEELANLAVQYAKEAMPKITGRLAGSLSPIFGSTFWGIYFPDNRAWYLEKGTKPFTMNRLAGKTIPMWVDDMDGSVAKEEGRKARTRRTPDGRRQTLIFRRAAKQGDRKTVMRRGQPVSVPKSYPGAPGRISNRLSSGQIGSPNIGVRWRHPGITGQHILNNAMEDASIAFGAEPDEVWLVDAATFNDATRGY